MIQAYLLTGESGIGKTSTLKKLVEQLGGEHCGGFYTVRFPVEGNRHGYRITTIPDGRVGLLADFAGNPDIRVGSYGVHLPFLENMALASVSNAMAAKRFVILDEIGPLHLCSAYFKQAVTAVMGSAIPLLGTISGAHEPFLDEIKRRDDVRLYALTEHNRDEIPALVLADLRAIPSHSVSSLTLFDLWKEQHFDVDLMSRETGVPQAMITAMLRFQPVGRLAAEKALAYLAHHYQQNYSLETVKVNLETI